MEMEMTYAELCELDSAIGSALLSFRDKQYAKWLAYFGEMGLAGAELSAATLHAVDGGLVGEIVARFEPGREYLRYRIQRAPVTE